MSLKICTRLIPLLLRNTQCRQMVISHGSSRLCKNCGCVLSTNVVNVLQGQTFRFLFTRQKTEEPNADGSFQVYYGTLTPQMRIVKLFSLLTSVTGIAAQPFLYNHISSLSSVPVVIVAYSFVGFFTLVTPFLLHFITKKYVTTLTYKPTTKTYVATTLNLFNIPRELEFKPEDVKVPDVLGMFTSFLVKGKPLFVDPRLFPDPEHYGKLMGYDKPLDLKLFETSLNEKKK